MMITPSKCRPPCFVVGGSQDSAEAHERRRRAPRPVHHQNYAAKCLASWRWIFRRYVPLCSPRSTRKPLPNSTLKVRGRLSLNPLGCWTCWLLSNRRTSSISSWWIQCSSPVAEVDGLLRALCGWPAKLPARECLRCVSSGDLVQYTKGQ